MKTGNDPDISYSTMVFIPVLNEAEVIENTINAIISQDIGEITVLVVDDRSDDGTIDIVNKMASKDERIELLVRNGTAGRGFSGIDAFKIARDRGIDVFVEMDADGSHNPCYLKELITEAIEYDIVIGSRFISGGKDNRPFFPRGLLTRLAGIYIRMILGLKVKDITSGYRAFSSKCLQILPMEKFRCPGPAILQEILFAASRNGCSIKEIPIVFTDRKAGETKLNPAKLLRSLIDSIMIRYRNIT